MTPGILIKSIPISSYEDLNAAEQEMRRLLRSQQQRIPICMTSESYHQFRCSVISMLLREEQELTPIAFHLPQGLVIRVQKDSDALHMNLLWEDACYSSSSEQQVPLQKKSRKHAKESKAKESKAKESKKRNLQ